VRKKLNNQEILIRDISKIAPEKIYDFKRKTIFSPFITGNNHLMLALVEGQYLAKSQNHTHAGDEVTLTLFGKAELTIKNKKYSILPKTAIRVPPGEVHPLVVTSKESWISIAAYCDQCILLNESNRNIISHSRPNVIIKDTSKVKFQNQNNFKIKRIFAHSIKDNGYINLSIIKSYPNKNGNRYQYYSFGESIFFTLSGSAEVESKVEKYLLIPEKAMLVSLDQNISLKVISKEPWIGIKISCESCPLFKTKNNKKNDLNF
jgi:quercetin dioxygenase-like cupin family protein